MGLHQKKNNSSSLDKFIFLIAKNAVIEYVNNCLRTISEMRLKELG